MLDQLSQAQRYVNELQPSPNELENVLQMEGPRGVADMREGRASAAADAISTVLNTTDDPKLKAQALLAQGDLNWQLANLPTLPGAATQPALQPPQTSDEYLRRSAQAYQEILDNPVYLKDRDAVTHAHFGLAAIAENRRDWESAQKNLSLIADDSDVPTELQNRAKDELTQLPTIESPIYLAPQAQATPALPVPTTQSTPPPSQPARHPATEPMH